MGSFWIIRVDFKSNSSVLIRHIEERDTEGKGDYTKMESEIELTTSQETPRATRSCKETGGSMVLWTS